MGSGSDDSSSPDGSTPDDSSSGSGNSNNGFDDALHPFLPGVPTPLKITYQSLTPTEVRSDPYLIPIYSALQPKLPSSLTSLKVRSIEKGTFANGTISYRIYYGDNIKDTCFLTIFFEPKKRQVIYLALEEKPQIEEPSFDDMFSSPSS